MKPVSPVLKFMILNLMKIDRSYSVTRMLLHSSYSIKPNTHRRRRRNSTRQLSRVGVGGVYWVLHDHRDTAPQGRRVT